jgi:hypothetical protein
MSQSVDPRSRLSTSGAPPSPSNLAFSPAVYARFYDMPPQEESDKAKTWLTRGQNFIVAFSEVKAGTRFERKGQPDEYVLLLPDDDMATSVSAGGETKAIDGFTITFVPPGDSAVEAKRDGKIIRLFSTRSKDLADKTSNAEGYREPHPHIPPFEPWPEPKDGYRIRSYSLDVPPEEGRFGKIWRCTTFMVNVFPPQHGPRDAAKLSPHHHDDFEQCSLVIGGEYMHHLRWPWTTNLADWREDDHELCGTPSVCVIPPKAIHTSAAVDPGVNLLIDIFSPPRRDFSEVEGWVLNSDEYPMPPKKEK